jgi:tungstate transport system permease protein
LRAALGLITGLDREMLAAVWTSVLVASLAIMLAALIGIPVGVVVAVREFRLKRASIIGLNTLMAMPTVVVGLVVYSLVSRQGLLGPLGLLFSRKAMIIGETVLAVPIVANYTLSAVTGADRRILPTAMTLGATRFQSVMQLTREVRFGVMAAVIAGFGRVLSEVGVAMMLGGNIRWYTRTMTTAIALETSKGEFAFALALGIVLLLVACGVNLLFHFLQESRA